MANWPLRSISRFVAIIGLAMALALAVPGSTDATSLYEVKKLLASDGQAGDRFGFSVAISGDTAVVGNWHEGGAYVNVGDAYIFQRDEDDAGNWGEVRKLTASDAESGDDFGFSVAISGDTVVVGAVFKDGGGTDLGAAYVFERDQGGADNWGEVKKLTASDAQTRDQFGVSVAVSGDTAVVGANGVDAGASFAGAAYVFGRDQGGADNWGEVTKLTASDAEESDLFGISVAIGGDTVVVGAHGEDAGASFAGAAYVFQRNEGGADAWGQVRKLTASDAQADDLFGRSVAVGGDSAVVGAHYEDAGGNYAGAAYVFQRDEGGADNWGEVKKLTASDAQHDDEFGISVAVSGDTAVVGAFYEDAEGGDAGAAYVFLRNEGGADNWGEVKKLTASDAQDYDHFGISAAISGDTAIVGAFREDAGGGINSNFGSAYVFEVPPRPVGGIALDSDLQPLRLETTDSGSSHWVTIAAFAAAAGLLALGGGAWYMKRRIPAKY